MTISLCRLSVDVMTAACDDRVKMWGDHLPWTFFFGVHFHVLPMIEYDEGAYRKRRMLRVPQKNFFSGPVTACCQHTRPYDTVEKGLTMMEIPV